MTALNHQRGHYDIPDLAAHVAELYAADCETFGYPTEILSPRCKDAKE